jgi:hypothetical protein
VTSKTDSFGMSMSESDRGAGVHHPRRRKPYPDVLCRRSPHRNGRAHATFPRKILDRRVDDA